MEASLIKRNGLPEDLETKNGRSFQFVELDSLALRLIWHWRGAGKTEGISDESLNAELLAMLK